MSPDPTHAATRAAEAIRRVASVEFHGPRTTDGDELAAIIAAHVPPDTPLNAVEAARECASEALAIKMYDRKVDADVFLAILRKHSDAHGPGAEARRHLERLLDCISETRGKDAYEAVAEARAFLDGTKQASSEAGGLKALREKIDDLSGTFDGFQWDNGAGSSGYNKAISDVLALMDSQTQALAAEGGEG